MKKLREFEEKCEDEIEEGIIVMKMEQMEYKMGENSQDTIHPMIHNDKTEEAEGVPRKMNRWDRKGYKSNEDSRIENEIRG